ncbi:MAG TPA: hypothetical protein H9687_06640 [Firmicutes bacterium]|nr:hypothetical protein [Bacillota bacterium]
MGYARAKKMKDISLMEKNMTDFAYCAEVLQREERSQRGRFLVRKIFR